MNDILDPLKDELSMLGQLSQMVSANVSRNVTQRESREIMCDTPGRDGSPRSSKDASKEPSPTDGGQAPLKFRSVSKEQLAIQKRISENGDSDLSRTASATSTPHESKNASLHKGSAMGSPSSQNASTHKGSAAPSPGASLHGANAMDAPMDLLNRE